MQLLFIFKTFELILIVWCFCVSRISLSFHHFEIATTHNCEKSKDTSSLNAAPIKLSKFIFTALKLSHYNKGQLLFEFRFNRRGGFNKRSFNSLTRESIEYKQEK